MEFIFGIFTFFDLLLGPMGFDGIVGGFLFFIILFGFLLKPVVGLTTFCMCRILEKRTGQTRNSAQGAIVFSLYDLALQMVYMGVLLMLIGMLGLSNSPVIDLTNVQSESSSVAAGIQPNWETFRLGSAILISALFAQGAALLLWKAWTRHPEFLPRNNLFLKAYAGINLLVFGLVVVGMASFCLYTGLEIIMEENPPLETSQSFKASLCVLAPSLFILSKSVVILGRTIDEVTSSQHTPLVIEAKLAGSRAAGPTILS